MITTRVIATMFITKLAEQLGRHTTDEWSSPTWTEPLDYSSCDQLDAVVSFDQDDINLLLVSTFHERLSPVVESFAQQIPNDAKFVVLPIPQGSVDNSRLNWRGISVRVLPVYDLHPNIQSYTISVAVAKAAG